MKLESFTRQNLPQITKSIDAALATVAAEYGISLKTGNCTYDPAGTFVMKVNGGIITEGGTVITKEEIALREMGKAFLGEDFDPKATYQFQGQDVRFVGLKSRGEKPFIYEVIATGKKFITSETGAKIIVRGKKDLTVTRADGRTVSVSVPDKE